MEGACTADEGVSQSLSQSVRVLLGRPATEPYPRVLLGRPATEQITQILEIDADVSVRFGMAPPIRLWHPFHLKPTKISSF